MCIPATTETPSPRVPQKPGPAATRAAAPTSGTPKIMPAAQLEGNRQRDSVRTAGSASGRVDPSNAPPPPGLARGRAGISAPCHEARSGRTFAPLHVRDPLHPAEDVVACRVRRYTTDELLQKAGWLIHQYDEVDVALTWDPHSRQFCATHRLFELCHPGSSANLLTPLGPGPSLDGDRGTAARPDTGSASSAPP